ncbi:uncharacterized protein N0V89_011252 [Didymosphaeria variabile]|uniref:Uncharacterized protein n=1 Tax=Didymosphaeria variabile TaxID=1932322 RepID=A0A9W8XEH6_9PLEO|nr:uncharacterized protein N0V89_011252 [Didymosphaeria variabile]KAJ4347312.1 hypothetical protein N0V89_011252 [Didymosphaeria variabile]
MILEHVLQYPGSYEIPLRTMYTLNCAPRAQPLPKDLSRAPSPTDSAPSSPTSGQMAWSDAECASMNFTSQLMSHINSIPQQPSSLPPSFIVSFVSRIFHPSLSLVDFPQALTALDYLRDLDNRWRKELKAAFARVHIHPDTAGQDIETLSGRYPGIALWAKNLEGKSRKAELYYAKLWLGLRRWIMINELSLQPFNKLNCMGMLNTILPPQPSSGGKLPSPLLNHQTLRQERDGFFNYIQQVQKQGPGVLEMLTQGESTKWSVVQKEVDKYLRVAKNIIDDCMATMGTEDFKSVDEPRKGKKTDSGVSFGSDVRPSTSSSTHDKPLPELHMDREPASKGLSKLEKLSREFKRMRVKSRPEVEEMVKMDQDLPMVGENQGKKIKKARSLANLRGRNSSSASVAGSRKGSDAIPFDAEEMRRARQLYDAKHAS